MSSYLSRIKKRKSYWKAILKVLEYLIMAFLWLKLQNWEPCFLFYIQLAISWNPYRLY